MGHKVDASNNLFEMYNRYYDNLPKKLQHKKLKSNEKKLSYLKTRSENKIDTAGAGEIGRSDTLQYVHLTEVAFYPDAKTVMAGLKQGSKYAKLFCIESTANGVGGVFYDSWQRAVEGNGAYFPIFLSWLDFPDYIEESLRVGKLQDFDDDERQRFVRDLGNSKYNEYPNEEETLMREYGATLLQLKWRRLMIDDECDGDINIFHQEYPRDPEEAFISSGRPVFNISVCRDNFEKSKKTLPIKTGDLIIKWDDAYKEAVSENPAFEKLIPYVEDVEFVENPRGFIKIWTDFEHQNGEVYRFAAGCDVAEGLEQGDYSEIRVLDRKTDEVCLTWHGHIPPDMLAEDQYKIWRFLKKDCHFGTEKNNHGLTTITKAYEYGVGQYFRQDFSKGYELSTNDFGWSSNMKTKPIIINELGQWIREGLYKDYDHDFWVQTLTFVKNPSGKMQAEGKDKDPSVKCFDDMIIAEAIMLRVSMWLPNYIGVKEDQVVARPTMKKKKRKVKF